MIGRIKTRHFYLVLFVAVALLFFHNCSSPPEELESTDGSSDSYEYNLPFAYTAKVDTIAHMSCSRVSGFDPRALFSFKAAAMTNLGGLGLTNNFIAATGAFSPAERAAALGGSKANANTVMQLSIRSSADYQSVWQSDAIREGEEMDAFLPDLDSAAIAGHLATMGSGQIKNYFPGEGNKRLMEASLRYMASETAMIDTRNNLANRTSLMVLGYTETANVLDPRLRGPSGVAARSAYGSGFQLDFKVPAGFTTAERRALNSVTELDLALGATLPVTWDCSSTYQFMIIRPEDIVAGRVACFTGADRYNAADPAQLPRLQAIRRVLRAEDWYVDVANRCVVPKTPADQCYGDRTGRPLVNYSATTCTGDSCPHYVTLCLRR